jgi:anti-sigma B factor antagonist
MCHLLHIDANDLGPLLWIRLDGDLDLAAEDGFASEVGRRLREGTRRVVVDARGVRFCDVSGARLLLALTERLESRGATVSYILAPIIRRVAELLGLTPLLDRQDGLESLGAQVAGLAEGADAALAEWSRPAEADPGVAPSKRKLLVAPPPALAEDYRMLVGHSIVAGAVERERSRRIAERHLAAVTAARRTRALVRDRRARRRAR